MSQTSQPGRWAATCKNGHRYTWDGPMVPVPPCPICAKQKERPGTSDDVAEAIAIAAEIQALAEELPDEGEEFGDSVINKAASIAANVEKHQRVTAGQMEALKNMLDGVQRWFE